jgi:hypothetical protein
VRCQIPSIKESHGKKIEYYHHIDYDERTPPSELQADLMCRTKGVMCPLAKECLALGLAIEAPNGVWGGRTLVDGKDYYKHEEEDD